MRYILKMVSVAVITGDIVASRAISSSSRQSLYAELKDFLNALKKEDWISNYEMFRGDSFQCVVEKKENVLRAALLIRAFIKSYVPQRNEAAQPAKDN